jgi:sugar phosphate permease
MIQNLLGASLGPIVMGAISDATDIQTAFYFLPFALIIASILFFLGSLYYTNDLLKVEPVVLKTSDIDNNIIPKIS